MKLRMEGGEEEASECSSGCQSGWTMYLDQSYENHPTSLPLRKVGSLEEEDEEEEDLSMVSDASSGPPLFHEEDEPCCDNRNGCCYFAPPRAAALAKHGGKRRRVEAGHQPIEQEPPSLLEDTASSKNATTTTKKFSVDDVLEFSCGFSATHFKDKSAFQKHLGCLQSPSPVKSVCGDGGEKKTR